MWSISLPAATDLLFAFASPGMTRSDGTGVIIPLGDFDWLPAPARTGSSRRVVLLIGVIARMDGEGHTEALDRADKARSAAKQGGRNRVVLG